MYQESEIKIDIFYIYILLHRSLIIGHICEIRLYLRVCQLIYFNIIRNYKKKLIYFLFIFYNSNYSKKKLKKNTEICKICTRKVSLLKSLCYESNYVLTQHIIRLTRINMKMHKSQTLCLYSLGLKIVYKMAM